MGQNENFWREAMAPYARARVGRSVLDVATSLVPYLALMAAMYFALDVSYWLVLAIAIPASGFLVRTFIVFHDCTHGSFMPTKRWNRIVGILTGLVVYTPFAAWRYDHAVHHATAGDLDRRGQGDVETWTVAEYYAKPFRSRLGYRLFRNPLVMFGLGPVFALALEPRWYVPAKRKRIVMSVILTDIGIAAIVALLCLTIGWQDYLLIQAPTIMVAGAAGIWLFYVQHQYEDVYWQSGESWSYADAALKGSSYLKLPQPLQFFTGNIGLHHVHHLSARVPNYNLQRAHDENEIFHDVPVLSLWDGLRNVRLKLYDEDTGRLVTFAAARRRRLALEAPASGQPLPEAL